MAVQPVLLIGGSGVVGRWTARALRGMHPGLPLLIGGRDRMRADEAARDLGNARGIVVDLAKPDLGLGERPVGAVAVHFTDARVAGLRFAQARRVPYVNISPGIAELGPEVASFIRDPTSSAVVLGTEWLVGATSVPTLHFARRFRRIDAIAIGALLDETDDFGPAAEGDLERQTKVMPAALERRDGSFVWRSGDALRSTVRALDGRVVDAMALSPNDVIGLATALDVPNVRFDLAVGVSSSRESGEKLSAEILIDIAGEGEDGRPLRTRYAVVHPQGQMPLTGLGVALLLERLMGLDGSDPAPSGLYFPHQLLRAERYLERFEAIGGTIRELETDR